jgi:hypothetical protein
MDSKTAAFLLCMHSSYTDDERMFDRHRLTGSVATVSKRKPSGSFGPALVRNLGGTNARLFSVCVIPCFPASTHSSRQLVTSPLRVSP